MRTQPIRAQGAHKGPAHKGPGGPIRAWPLRAEGAHKGAAHEGPRAHKGPLYPATYAVPWGTVGYLSTFHLTPLNGTWPYIYASLGLSVHWIGQELLQL